MKQTIIALAFIFTFMGTKAEKPFRLTFLASPQFSWMKSDLSEIDNYNNSIGFNYGVETDIFWGSENYAFTTGLTINNIGGDFMYDTDGDFTFAGKSLPSGSSINFKLRYLEIPLALKLRSKEFDRFNFFAQFGIANWFKLKSESTSSEGTIKAGNVKDEFKFYNIALNIGAGVEYNLGENNAITFGLIFNNGFLDVTNNEELNDVTSMKIFRLRTGFIF